MVFENVICMDGKYDALEPVARKIQALDNPVKLKILAMLIEEGSKSVTDISKDLKLNFSTAHKYLEQLQSAGLVSSKEVSENRLKRMFFVEPFDLDISPQGIAKIIDGKKREQPRRTFKVINERGEEVEFEEKIFSQKYLKRGLPSTTIKLALDSVLAQAYDGVTLIELRELFRQALSKRVEIISSVMEMIESSEIRGKTYYNFLKLNNPEALKMHMDGDIFIQNLGEPKLLNFVHDVYGISQHGVTGRRPKTAAELFSQILAAMKFVSEFTMPQHSVDSFNYFIAPFCENLRQDEIVSTIKKFLSDVNSSNYKTYFCIEVGKPKFMESLPVQYLTESTQGEKSETYAKYHALANKLASDIITIIAKENFSNVRLVVKLWNAEIQSNLPKDTFVANMSAAWQHPNASFAGFTRFDPDWKKWFGTNRVGEVQEIVINLPKIAKSCSSLQEFEQKTKQIINFCYSLLLDMAEVTAGEFLRNYNTTLPSAQRERWSYLHLEDSPYSVSVAGLPETITILRKKYAGKDLWQIAEKIHKNFYELCSKHQLRINLKQNRTRSITMRLAKFAGVNLNYAAPIAGNILDAQKLFPGGHVEFLTTAELGKLKGQFGFARII